MTGDEKRRQEIEEVKRFEQLMEPGLGQTLDLDKYLRHTVHNVGGHTGPVTAVAVTPDDWPVVNWSWDQAGVGCWTCCHWRAQPCAGIFCHD